MDYYLDPDTGEYIPANEVDTNLYDIVPLPEAMPQRVRPEEDEAGWLQTLSSIGVPAMTSISNAVAGGAELLGDLSNTEGLSSWGKRQRELGNVLSDWDMQRLNLDPGGAKSLAYNITGRGLPMAAAMLGSGGMAAPFLTTTTAQNFGERYGELKEQGAGPGDAGLGALGSSAMNLVLNKIGLSPAFKVGKPLGSKVLQTGMIDPVTNVVGEVGDMLIDRAASGKVPTFDEFALRAKGGVVGGLTMGPALAGVAHVGQRLGGGGQSTQATRMTPQMDAEINSMAEQIKTFPKPEPTIKGDEVIAQNTFPEPIQKTVAEVETKPAKEDIPVAQTEQEIELELSKIDPEITADATIEDAPQATLDPQEFPIQRIRVEDIGVDPDLMQYKASDDTETGTNERDRIKGKNWDEQKAGNIQLFEPKKPLTSGPAAGKRFIAADGHHRVEFANRLGNVNALNAMIMREADGYSAADARAKAAEINIANDKGTIYDQAKYLRSQAEIHGKDASLARAAEEGIRGRNAATVAFDAEDNLYTAFVREVVTPEQAVAIASAAPGDDAKQRAGIDIIQRQRREDPNIELSGSEISDMLQALDIAAEEKAAGWVQQDIFGKDSVDVAMASATRIRDRMQILRRTLSENIRAVKNLSKRPDIAERFKIPIGDPSAKLAKVKALEQEYHRSKRWGLYPDLKAYAKDPNADPEMFVDNILQTGSAPIPDPNQVGMFERMGGEGGGTRIISDITNTVRDLFTPEGIDEIAQSIGDNVSTQKTETSERFFEGRVGIFEPKYHIGVGSKVLSATRKGMTFPKTVFVDKFPHARPVFDTAMKQEADIHTRASTLMKDADPYMLLKDRTKVDKVLRALRRVGDDVPVTPENLKRLGLDDAEVKAVYAYRQVMDDSIELFRDSLYRRYKPKPDSEDPEGDWLAYKDKVDNYIAHKKSINYVPFSRFGDFFVDVKDASGERVEFYQFDTKAAMMQKVRELAPQKHLKITKGQMKNPPHEAYEQLPASLLAGFESIDPEIRNQNKKLPPQGFMEHMLEAKLMAGETEDLGRSLVDYVVGISRYTSLSDARPKWDQAIASIDPKREPGLYKYAKEYKDYMTTSQEEWQSLRQLFAMYYLAGNPKSAAVNLSQTLTMTYPQLTKFVSTGEAKGIWFKNLRRARQYLNNGEQFRKSHPELGKALDEAWAAGVTNEAEFRQLTGRARGKDPTRRSYSDVAMILFDSAEKLNRVHAFMSGYDAASKQGLKGEQRIQFAQDFVNDTQFIYSKANRPEWARGRKAAAFTFRSFTGNWIRQLRNHLFSEDWPVAARMLGAMGALGGAAAMPLMKELIKGFESAGHDPEREIRKVLGDGALGDVFMYGIPNLAGINISGAIGLGELAPDLERGADSAILRGALGVPYDFFVAKPAKAAWLLNEMDSPYRAVEALLPEGLRNPAVTVRGMMEGWRAPDLEPYIEKPTPYQLGVKGLGFTPTELAKQYKIKHSADLLDEQSRENDNINFKIAKALFNKDKAKLRKLLTDLAKHNAKAPAHRQIKPSDAAIESHMLGMIAPDAARMRRTPEKARPEMLEILNRR